MMLFKTRFFQNRVARLVVIGAWLVLASAAGLSGQTLTKILDNGSNATHINLVLLSEGYTSAELTSKFPADAQAAVNGFFQASPYSEYKPYFNIYTIAVASNQSGSDHYTPTISLKDTYFNSTYDSSGIDRLVTIPPNSHDSSSANGSGKVSALLQQFVPDYDLVGLIVNDSVYGGSGGGTIVFSTNTQSSELFRHESAHTIGRLADEYTDPFPSYTPAEAPNVTQQTNRSLIKWAAWILGTTPIPTPDTATYNAVDGLFEGAEYQTTGWYRPKHDCRMRSLGIQFCEICSEALVLSVYRDVRPIESYSPSNLSLSAPVGSSLTFTATRKVPATHQLTSQWSVDGAAVSGATGNQFSISTLSRGAHTVSVAVTDPTTLVRTDTARLLTDSKTWNVQIADGTTRQTFFTGETALANGVYYLQFPSGSPFGYYSYLQDPKYLYHFDLGYEYIFDAADGKGGVYFYDFKSQGYFYTSPSFPFPYMYDFSLNSTVYYYPDPTNPGHYNTNGTRYFYVFNTGRIISK